MSSRKITTGKVGRQILGSVVVEDNSLQSIVTNANIVVEPNGTGVVESTADIQVNNNKGVVFKEAAANGANYVKLQSPATLSGNTTYTLPGTVTADYFLTTDSSGNLSWANATVNISNQTTDTATYYPMITTSTSGTVNTVNTSTTKLSFQPSTGTLTSTALSATNATLTNTLTAASIVETSSIVLKENIQPIENALSTLLKLKGVTYDRKDGSAKDEAGFIAEEVAEVLPNLVVKDELGNPYGINYTKFSAYLIEAVKSLVNEINVLKGNK